MIPVAFDYAKPQTLAEASRALAAAGGHAVVLSGGQSLMTELKHRRKRPKLVIDLQAVQGLSATEIGSDSVRIGAMARQTDIAGNREIVSRLPLLAEIATVAADPMVRRRGTLVGAICAAEQGGDWLAGCLAMDGIVEIAGPQGSRELPLTEFVRGARTTALAADEIAVALRLRPAPAGARSAYRKVKHIAIGWSIASVAAVIAADAQGRCTYARIAVSGASAHPQRLQRLETALMTLDLRQSERVRDAVAESLSKVTFWGDYYASADYRAERLTQLVADTIGHLAGAPSDR